MNNLEELESEAIHIIREPMQLYQKGSFYFQGKIHSIIHIAMSFYPLDLPLGYYILNRL